jgi:mono/diheme cytochrome c family protein
MRRPQPTAFRIVVLLVIVLIAAGCSDSKPGAKVVSPVPGNKLVIIKAPKGDPAAGKTLFASNGCAACHTFKPAGATGKVGPDLDNLAQYATTANQGTLQQFVSASITDPGAYVQPGYQNGIMPTTYSSLTPKQIADLVAFLTQ